MEKCAEFQQKVLNSKVVGASLIFQTNNLISWK